MLLTTEDFNEDPYHLPDLTDQEEEFDTFADKKEKEALEKIFGPLFSDEVIAAFAAIPVVAPWIALRDGEIYYPDGPIPYRWPGLKNVLKPYVYSKWVERTYIVQTHSGPVVADHENMKLASPRKEIVDSYNAFVRMVGYSPYAGRRYRWGVHGTTYSYLMYRMSFFPNWRHTDLRPKNYWDL